MKAVKGFVTNDGTFFEDEVEAQYFERRTALMQILNDQGYVPDEIITILNTYPIQVVEYIQSFARMREREHVNSTQDAEEAKNKTTNQPTFDIDDAVERLSQPQEQVSVFRDGFAPKADSARIPSHRRAAFEQRAARRALKIDPANDDGADG